MKIQLGFFLFQISATLLFNFAQGQVCEAAKNSKVSAPELGARGSQGGSTLGV